MKNSTIIVGFPPQATELVVKIKGRPGRSVPHHLGTFHLDELKELVLTTTDGRQIVVRFNTEIEGLDLARLLDALVAVVWTQQSIPLGVEDESPFLAQPTPWLKKQLSLWVESGRTLQELAEVVVEHITRGNLISSLERGALIQRFLKNLKEIVSS